MGEEIASENRRISDFQGLVTLTLDRVILHTFMHHSSTSTYIPNFIEIKKTFCGRTDGHLRPTNVIRSTRRSRPKKYSLNQRVFPMFHSNSGILKAIIIILYSFKHLTQKCTAECKIQVELHCQVELY